ncbi:solute carrier family 41 member 1-like isoform X1 [Photinus pyralis]|nr:solute carrier family 41 member 1-like isoform X1 [Photinus pyralis]XP_031335739.1 solute carrier family 41 member 1-like isoform X1 [Photinus pyralis]XP_031335740.1 solute carrier family 41 member 1-like isoform X1 [Photinus pyralis]XP_031335741.1 solute carrier family 41 member 1-like isoform X1 [Photinus pyralis]
MNLTAMLHLNLEKEEQLNDRLAGNANGVVNLAIVSDLEDNGSIYSITIKSDGTEHTDDPFEVTDAPLGITTEFSHDESSINSGVSMKTLESTKLSDRDSNWEYSNSDEKWYSITLQVFIPFILAGFGTIGAGLVLGKTEKEEIFKKVDSLYILVPAIIGLKGNLDMCLATRLSTAANVGQMDSKKQIMKMVIGNIGLVQIQAIVAAVVVSVYAVLISALLMQHSVLWEDIVYVSSCSILTASTSCFILDIVLCSVIVMSFKHGMNPDNFATSCAASIGDVVSLSALSLFAGAVYLHRETLPWICYAICGIYIFAVLPFWTCIVIKNKYTKHILTEGWIPVFSALFISGLGGLILDSAVGQFRGFVVFQPIINGIGGNLASVHTSRISTMLQKSSLPGIIPPHTKLCVTPWTALVSGVFSAKAARILILISLPAKTLFIFVADIIYNKGVSCITPAFISAYLGVSLIQIIILLYAAHILTHLLWKLKINPDNAAIPFLTATGDLLGTCLLVLAFTFLTAIGHPYQPVF